MENLSDDDLPYASNLFKRFKTTTNNIFSSGRGYVKEFSEFQVNYVEETEQNKPITK